MPFTPSHAVVALPFVRTPLVPAAIAIGAMTPDLPLFVRGTPLTYGVTHSGASIIITTLVALTLFVLWRMLLRPALVEFVPAAVANRLPESWRTGGVSAAADAVVHPLRRSGVDESRWRPLSAAIIAASAMLGVASHILWDGFTHEGRWGTTLVPAIDEQWGPLMAVKWLQHGSSVLGLLILTVAALVWFRRTPAVMRAPRRLAPAARMLWWAALPITLIAAWLIGLAVYGPLDETFTVAHLAYRVLPPACAIWGIASLAIAVLLLLTRPRPGRFAK